MIISYVIPKNCYLDWPILCSSNSQYTINDVCRQQETVFNIQFGLHDSLDFQNQSLYSNPNNLAAAAKSHQLCPTPCHPIDGSPPGSPVPGILQARTLEWVAISFSNAWKWKVKSESEVAQLCPTLRDPMEPTRLLHPWDFPGKSTGVGCHCPLWGGSN